MRFSSFFFCNEVQRNQHFSIILPYREYRVHPFSVNIILYLLLFEKKSKIYMIWRVNIVVLHISRTKNWLKRSSFPLNCRKYKFWHKLVCYFHNFIVKALFDYVQVPYIFKYWSASCRNFILAAKFRP